MLKKTHFHVKDNDTLIVLVRFIESVGGRCSFVRPINDGFVVTAESPFEIEVDSTINFRPFTSGVDTRRVYWSDIVTLDPSVLVNFGIDEVKEDVKDLDTLRDVVYEAFTESRDAEAVMKEATRQGKLGVVMTTTRMSAMILRIEKIRSRLQRFFELSGGWD